LNIRERIQTRIDELTELLETQSHPHSPELVTEKLESVTKFWADLSEEERDYIASVRFAINDKLAWSVKTDSSVSGVKK
jgi:hypothetical protein